MNEYPPKRSHRHHKDDSDVFRESSLRAIRRRKQCARILLIVASVCAVIMLALVFAAYFLDK